MVAELRLAGATTLEQTQAVLDEFVPRFNRRFGVPPQCSEPAFRPLDQELCLEQVLCFKHRRKVARDNTVRFQLRTLQLLPVPERPSYAGAVVEVLEGLDSQLMLRHEGRIVTTQEAPLSPVFLRTGHEPYTVPPVVGQEPEEINRTSPVVKSPPRHPQPSLRASRPSFRRSAGKRSRKPDVRACHCGQ